MLKLHDVDTLIGDLAWLDDQRQPMIDMVIDLCNQNSGTLHLEGVAKVHDKIREYFSILGGEMQSIDTTLWQTIDERGEMQVQQLGRSLHIVCRPESAFKVMLCIHCDTVYGRSDSFQTCRWLDEETLNGPGVADAKGGIVVMLFALQVFERSELAKHIGWEVIINPDEEIGSPGSLQLISARATGCNIGLLFEPSLPGGLMVSWRKGSGNFTFVVRGKSAHAGRDFHEGRNAIVAAAKLIAEIAALNGKEEDVTINVGQIQGGGAVNIVPDLAVVQVNARVMTNEQQKWILEQFRQLIKRIDEKEGISVTMHGDFYSPPKVLDAGTQALQKRIELCGQALGLDVKWQGSGGASDGNKFLAAGLSNIDSLGPNGGRIHSSDEFLLVDSLVPRTKLAALILLSLAAEQK